MKKAFYGFLAICLLAGCEKKEKVLAISLDVQTLDLRILDTYPFVVTHEPSDLPAPLYQWSSSQTSVATVSATGLVTAVGEGAAIITVTSSGTSLSAACEVRVGPQLATQIVLSQEHLALVKGEKEALSCTLVPAGSVIPEVQWNSSDETVALVDQHGMITAVDVGNAVITVCDWERPEVKASCTVTVSPRLAESIVLSWEELTLRYQAEEALSFTVFPQDAVVLRPFWRSADPDIVSVDQEGNIKGVSPGTTLITFLDQDNPQTAAHCSVTVLEENATSIEVYPPVLTLQVDDEVVLNYQIFPENTTDEVVWFSDHEEIATVDDFGRVKALDVGTCTISLHVVNGTLSGSSKITVVRPITAISLDREALTMRHGDTYSLQTSFFPENATPPAAFSWSSSDPWVATVDQQGNITAHRIGMATIRVETDGFFAACTLTVNPVYNSWSEPALLFLESQAQIRNAERRNVNNSLTNIAGGQAMVYDGESSSRLKYCVYTFSSDQMTAALLAFADNDNTGISAARGFCEERYKWMSASGGVNVYEDKNGTHIEVGYRNLSDYVGIPAWQLALIGLSNRWFIISYAW